MEIEVEKILDYWFGHLKELDDYPEAKSKLWFRKDESTDTFIRREFSASFDRVASLPLTELTSNHRRALAAVILLDQFTRNSFRDDPDAFFFDKDAQSIVKKGLEKGLDQEMFLIERAFFYMPLMHSEAKSTHKISLKKFKELQDAATPKFRSRADSFLKYAQSHADIVNQFGRYPHRNKILGRESTAEEIEFLKKPGSSF